MKKATKIPTPEEFQAAISQWSAAEISERLGCKLRTAYGWLRGERVPEDWQRRIYLEVLGRK